MTSAYTWLIAPDKQTERIGYPDMIVPYGHARLFFSDETDLHLCPDTGRTYHLKGIQLKVDSPGKDEVKYVIGSVEYPSGEGLYEVYPHKRHQEYRMHLEHLMEMYPRDYLFVVRDNASQHVTPHLDEFLIANREHLCLVSLPTYSPHLNLIDHMVYAR